MIQFIIVIQLFTLIYTYNQLLFSNTNCDAQWQCNKKSFTLKPWPEWNKAWNGACSVQDKHTEKHSRGLAASNGAVLHRDRMRLNQLTVIKTYMTTSLFTSTVLSHCGPVISQLHSELVLCTIFVIFGVLQIKGKQIISKCLTWKK